jgi:putative PIN family toxin of toxin-antitoxin system
MRVILDTNLLIASLISAHGAPARAYALWREGRYTLVTSDWQIEELRRVSRYDKLQHLLVPAAVGVLVNGLRRRAEVVGPLPTLDLSRDPDDNFVLATAVAGRADYLVTGDRKDLVPLEKVAGIRIVKASVFLDLF